MVEQLYHMLEQYVPYNKQEQQDRSVMMRYVMQFEDILERENVFAHVTASPWIVNRDASKVLLIYHRIFDSWGWCGGHCDGDADFQGVAVREGREETGLSSVRLYSSGLLALDILPVVPHVRKGGFVSAHVHLNLTYLCTADETEVLHHKEDEAKGAMWVRPDEVEGLVAPWDRDMIPVYRKLNQRMKNFLH